MTYYGRFGNIDELLPPLLGVYDFNISVFEFDYLDRNPNLKGNTIKDPRIAATIIQVIINHLSDPYKALLFICDEDANRQRGQYRQTLFSAWHKAMGSLIGLRLINPIIETTTES